MTAALRAQIKVASKVEELEREQPMTDLDCPDDTRRLSFEQSMQLIADRYSKAIDLLGKI